MDRISKTWRATLIAALLGAVTLAAFYPVLHNDFIRYDDRAYVTANPHVLNGLSWDGLRWAFTTGHGGNWHPVTWLSHMLDVQLFGVRPGWHHFSGLLLHITNAILLFLLLRKLTGAEWRSAFVAGFFALHPLRAESVAWAAERKDVLSGFFFLLTLWAYAKYTEKSQVSSFKSQDSRLESQVVGRGQEAGDRIHRTEDEGQTASESTTMVDASAGLSRIHCDDAAARRVTQHATRYYLWALVLFALGLMSKPMLVTVPFILLLLDFWPLKRVGRPGQVFGSAWVRLLREKSPFFGLALISSVITYAVQGRGHAVTITLPLTVRVGNAVVAYWKYLAKTVWPTELAIFYPHPATRYPVSELWPGWLLVVAALVLAAVTAFAVFRRGRAPWLVTGWLWYVGMLVPVAGLVQVGLQGMADRYTYLPLIGVSVFVVWGATELWANRRWATQALATAGLLALATCAGITHGQVKYWRNNLTVFEHALAVNPNNAVAHCHVGIELGEERKYEMAVEHFNAALKADPNCAEAYYGLGFTLENLGKPADAVEQYRNALRARPWYEPAHSRLGTVLWSLGQREQALGEYEAALRLNADDLEVQYRLGTALLDLGELARAVPHLDYVARVSPDFGDVLNRLTDALLRQGRQGEAEGRLSDLAGRFPRNPAVRINLGAVLWQRGKAEPAIAQYGEALRLDPANPVAHYNLGTAVSMLGGLAEAATEFEEAIRLKPDYLPARISLGEVLAAQGKMEEAVKEFREAVRLSPTNASLVLNLGNALLMAGHPNEAAARFGEALRLQPDLPEKLAQAARTLASQGRAPAAIARLATALKLKPDSTAPLNQLAWVLATDQRAEVRNGGEAVRLAERASELDGGKDFRLLVTLAAAYAEAGRFEEAVATAEKARDLATAAGQKEVVELSKAGLEMYQKKLPYRQ